MTRSLGEQGERSSDRGQQITFQRGTGDVSERSDRNHPPLALQGKCTQGGTSGATSALDMNDVREWMEERKG